MKRELIGLAVGLTLSGCAIRDQSIFDQPKVKAWTAPRVAPPGTVTTEAPPKRPALSAALLDRGQERFQIFCAPCHGLTGQGDGMIVRRGFPAPPSLHEARLRAADLEHFYSVISHGYGNMYSYGDRVPPADRWAIACYIRALQRSQEAP